VNSDSLKYVLPEFADRPLPASRPRELSLPTDSGKVIGLSGVRRCGKTFLFFDTIRQLVASGVDRRRHRRAGSSGDDGGRPTAAQGQGRAALPRTRAGYRHALSRSPTGVALLELTRP